MFKRFPNLIWFAALLLPLSFLIAACSAERGEALFDEQGCRNCHSFKGRGGNLAPDLTAVGERRSASWIRQQIRDSTKNDPASRMPPYGHLSGTEIRALVAYLKR